MRLQAEHIPCCHVKRPGVSAKKLYYFKDLGDLGMCNIQYIECLSSLSSFDYII